MNFDIIIGNPPYQERDGDIERQSAKPLYNKFIEKSLIINPDYISFIIPARWINGGKGLDDLRRKMLGNGKLSYMHIIDRESTIFSDIMLPGGLVYFILDKNKPVEKPCIIESNNTVQHRILNQDTTILLDPLASRLSDRLLELGEPFSNYVSERKYYGIDSDAIKYPEKYNLDFSLTKDLEHQYKVYGVIDNHRVERYISKDVVKLSRQDRAEKYKIFISKAVQNTNNILYSRLRPFIGKPGDICTETYLDIGPFDSLGEAQRVFQYIETSIFHFIVMSGMSGQNISRKSFDTVSMIDTSEDITDSKLCSRLVVNDTEFQYILQKVNRQNN